MGTISQEQHATFVEKAKQSFVPYKPVTLVDLFQGRKEVVRQLVEEIRTPGRHVVLYGDRGVGKTSLAGLAYFFCKRDEELTHFVRCSATSTFDTIFADVLSKSGITHVPGGISVTAIREGKLTFPGNAGLTLRASQSRTLELEPVGGQFVITPQFVCRELGSKGILIIIDEYDRFSHSATDTALADTIKHLSDSDSETKIMVVGVAESVGELLGSHPSIARSVAEVKLDRMTSDELDQVLQAGFSKVGLRFPPRLATRIVGLSDGYPHFTHLLGLKICLALAERCLDRDGEQLEVLDEDYRTALTTGIEGSQETLRTAFQKATQTVKRKSDLFTHVLEGMAFSTQPEVQVNELVKNINHIYVERLKVQSISYHLGELVKDDRGKVLVRPRTGYYKFRDPMLRAFVRLRLERKNQELFSGQLVFPFMRQTRVRSTTRGDAHARSV